uniref:C-type lectin domain-containing protein n=1 Tax=Pundamilia nyererei TaxID=303518 RepID=A0A3B4G189_9CICH
FSFLFSSLILKSFLSTDCPRGWIWISGRCFRYVPALMNWANAEINCLYMGANLASVHSSWEYREIQRLTAPYGYTEAWLGGTDAPNVICLSLHTISKVDLEPEQIGHVKSQSGFSGC